VARFVVRSRSVEQVVEFVTIECAAGPEPAVSDFAIPNYVGVAGVTLSTKHAPP
jgi:hypothetical protein